MAQRKDYARQTFLATRTQAMKPKPKDSSNTRLIRALQTENAKLKKQLAHLNNDIGIQMNSLKAIAKTVGFPANETLEHLPIWVWNHWSKSEIVIN